MDLRRGIVDGTWQQGRGDRGANQKLERVYVLRQGRFLLRQVRLRLSEYLLSLIEIRLDKDGTGVGKMAVATKIEFDKKKKQMVLENYASEPVRLNEVKIQK